MREITTEPEPEAVYLEGVIQSVDRRRVHGTDHLQDSVKVVQFLENLQDLDDPRHDGDSFLQVLRFYDTPAERTHTPELLQDR